MARKGFNYTPERVEQICKSIKDLKGRVGACREARLDYQTFLNWMDRYPEFAKAIKDAEGEMEQRAKVVAVQSVFKGMKEHWQAGAWWLERKHAKDYAIQSRVDAHLSGEVTTNGSGHLLPVTALDEQVAGTGMTLAQIIRQSYRNGQNGHKTAKAGHNGDNHRNSAD